MLSEKIQKEIRRKPGMISLPAKYVTPEVFDDLYDLAISELQPESDLAVESVAISKETFICFIKQ